MSERYKIVGMGKGFDGLIVESRREAGVAVIGGRFLLPIDKLTNNNVMFGDRSVSFPISQGVLFIEERYLEPTDETPREYDSKNPHGVFLCDHRYRRNDLEVVVAEYERAMTVTVLEHELQDGKYGNVKPASERDVVHTRYTQNYVKEMNFQRIKDQIEAEVKGGDLDDLIFYLKAVKEEETNG